ncbi:MAG TPA: hypothetical protein VHK03_14225 [Aestuariivirgaceae bacterium]|jgi:hypothetical protein|nr:hypothetical protein [Aestuariivirgaceae bacterium]
MTTIILAAVIPLSVNFLLAAAAFRIPELGLVPNGAEPVPDVSTEPESNEQLIGADVINEAAPESGVKQAA